MALWIWQAEAHGKERNCLFLWHILISGMNSLRQRISRKSGETPIESNLYTKQGFLMFSEIPVFVARHIREKSAYNRSRGWRLWAENVWTNGENDGSVLWWLRWELVCFWLYCCRDVCFWWLSCSFAAAPVYSIKVKIIHACCSLDWKEWHAFFVVLQNGAY